MIRIVALLALVPLLACSPAQQCRYQATRDLKAIDRQIAETSTDIARGYRVVQVESPFFDIPVPCMQRNSSGELEQGTCYRDPPPVYQHQRINVEAERAKLASLEAQRDRMLPQVKAALAACPQD